MTRKTAQGGRFSVSGPGVDDRSTVSENAGISLAQNFACRAEEPGTWYVRDFDTVVYHVERNEDGVVITKRA